MKFERYSTRRYAWVFPRRVTRLRNTAGRPSGASEIRMARGVCPYEFPPGDKSRRAPTTMKGEEGEGEERGEQPRPGRGRDELDAPPAPGPDPPTDASVGERGRDLAREEDREHLWGGEPRDVPQVHRENRVECGEPREQEKDDR